MYMLVLIVWLLNLRPLYQDEICFHIHVFWASQIRLLWIYKLFDSPSHAWPPTLSWNIRRIYKWDKHKKVSKEGEEEEPLSYLVTLRLHNSATMFTAWQCFPELTWVIIHISHPLLFIDVSSTEGKSKKQAGNQFELSLQSISSKHSINTKSVVWLSKKLNKQNSFSPHTHYHHRSRWGGFLWAHADNEGQPGGQMTKKAI